MQEKYSHLTVEKKWQDKWIKENLYRTDEDLQKPKYYILDMFPYPSGAGLHVGHPKGYIATDILARMKMMSGASVLHPMGWDAFGLPAENHALKTGEKPAVATGKNIATFKAQLQKLGLGYDWEREVNTTDPDFYRWTQWCFLKFWEHYYDEERGQARPIQDLIKAQYGADADYYELDAEQKAEIDGKRLAFESWAPINWCPSCQTGLANEDLEDGVCERCGSEVERKPMRQWVLRITKYADRILDDLNLLPEWDDSIKQMQSNWIGRSEGAEVIFRVKAEDEELSGQKESSELALTVFTTRIDTLSGCTYVVVAPEHPLLKTIGSQCIKNWQEVEEYVEGVKNKSELERTDLNKDKTGVKIEGWQAVNPLNNELVSIWVADYVLGDYGTGAVMAVPAHDERDWDFARKYNLPIRVVISPDFANSSNYEKPKKEDVLSLDECYTNDGILVDSGIFSGLHSSDARAKITQYLAENEKAKLRVNYKIKDWVFSRQRYWGEPIPMIHCQKCGVVPVPESELPVKLPEVEKYEPSGTGESPLVEIRDWVEVACPHCGGAAERETNTMPQWAGSSWYYLRYCDAKNETALIDPTREKYWNPVDFYVGGAEHATRHLIYARFWHKFLFDLRVVTHIEPFTSLRNQGLILAEDGRKMSKRWGNVINPDDVVEKYGADALRVYEMFMSPFNQACAWNMQGVSGVRRFLEKVWSVQEKIVKNEIEKSQRNKYLLLLEQTIFKVSQDIEDFKFNTAVSAMMILLNRLTEADIGAIQVSDYKRLILVLSPFAPHMAEEIWENLGQSQSIFKTAWPIADEEILAAAQVKIMIQINGKLRGEMVLSPEEANDKTLVLNKAKHTLIETQKLNEQSQIVKEIYVPKKIVNIVM